jgi:hypothetical protein
MVALFESLWFYKCEVKKGPCVLFWDINILLPVGNNLEQLNAHLSLHMDLDDTT